MRAGVYKTSFTDMKKENVIALVCNSNMFVPYVLTKILENQRTHFLVLSDTENIAKLFHQLSLPNISFYKYEVKGHSDIIACKKRIMALFKEYEFIKLIFFHAEFGELINWFIKKASKKTPIYYCKIFEPLPYPKARFFKALRPKMKQYLYWGVNMDILDTGTNLKPSLPTSFFKSINVQNINIEINHSLINKELNTFLKSLHIKANNILLTGTVVKCGYVNSEEYTKGIDEIIDQLGIDNIVSKCHPRFSNLYGKESQLTQMPHYLPGNLIINQFNIFIGYESTLLVEAAIAGKLVISLLYYFIPTNKSTQENWHSLLNNRLNGRGIIYYPQNIYEFKEIISRVYVKQDN